MEEPKIRVGICDGYPEIRGHLNGIYRAGGPPLTGGFVCRPLGGVVVLYDAFGREVIRGPEIRLTAERSGTFTLQEVTIGVRFHWERREAQTFPGDLAFLSTGAGVLAAVNELPVEEYLASVVSSEVSGEAPFAFLKAHAIASRSWLVAMLNRRGSGKEEGGIGEPRSGGKGRSSAGTTVRTTPALTSVRTTTASGIKGSPAGLPEGLRRPSGRRGASFWSTRARSATPATTRHAAA